MIFEISEEIRVAERYTWLSVLTDLANIDFPRDVGPNEKITNPRLSYRSLIGCYFDDLHLSTEGYEALINFGICTPEEYECVKDFHEALSKYVENGIYDEKFILEDPKGLQIIALGKKSIARLLEIVPATDKEVLLAPQNNIG